MVLFILQYEVRFWLESKSVTIQIKAIEQYFPVVLFIMLNEVVLTFESVEDNPNVWSFK